MSIRRSASQISAISTRIRIASAHASPARPSSMARSASVSRGAIALVDRGDAERVAGGERRLAERGEVRETERAQIAGGEHCCELLLIQQVLFDRAPRHVRTDVLPI